jgi:hypothetical protein
VKRAVSVSALTVSWIVSGGGTARFAVRDLVLGMSAICLLPHNKKKVGGADLTWGTGYRVPGLLEGLGWLSLWDLEIENQKSKIPSAVRRRCQLQAGTWYLGPREQAKKSSAPTPPTP